MAGAGDQPGDDAPADATDRGEADGRGEASARGWRAWSARWRRESVYSVGEDPDYRFSLANERTFLAWIRTSLALLAGGVAVVQVVPRFAVPGSRHLLGVPLVLMSIVVAVTSYRHWADSERALRLRRPLPPTTLPRILGVGVALVSLLALVFVLLGGTGPK